MKKHGADYVLLDDESLSEQLFSVFPKGVDKVLELIGTVTLKSSLKLLSEHGILCMTGILGGEWALSNFEPMADIPSGTYFTQFDSQNIKEEIIIKLFNRIKEDLRSCYKSCLECAVKNEVRTIAFCCISTGEFHFPNERAAEIAMKQ